MKNNIAIHQSQELNINSKIKNNMKKFTAQILTILFVLSGIIFSLTNCTKHDQTLDLAPVLPTQGDTLTSIKVATAPTILPIGGAAWDGTIEPAWETAKKLTVNATVPDLGNGTFAGFIGNQTNISVRSMYDATNIYFLVEFSAPQKNISTAQWYYNPLTKLWAQESGAPVANPDGSFRPPFTQDQFSFLFNVANSVLQFNTLSCYAACHANTTFSTTTSTGGYMHTNGPTEILDCWRIRMNQAVTCNQANDTYIDWGNGILNVNEVHNDLQVNNGPTPIADGGFSNVVKNMKTNGKVNNKTMNVPMWVIPTAGYTNSAILLKDTLATGKALKVISVDSTGVLTLSNNTTIDPRVGTDYMQIGNGDGPKSIPGSIVAPYTGSRGDVIANAFFTGTGWRILLKRALKTSDGVNDVDFSSLKDQPFGVAAMFNGANNQHAIAAGLMLRFQKK
jgi:hypothetical protein